MEFLRTLLILNAKLLCGSAEARAHACIFRLSHVNKWTSKLDLFRLSSSELQYEFRAIFRISYADPTILERPSSALGWNSNLDLVHLPVRKTRYASSRITEKCFLTHENLVWSDFFGWVTCTAQMLKNCFHNPFRCSEYFRWFWSLVYGILRLLLAFIKNRWILSFHIVKHHLLWFCYTSSFKRKANDSFIFWVFVLLWLNAMFWTLER